MEQVMTIEDTSKTLFSFDIEVMNRIVFDVYLGKHIDPLLGRYWGLTISSFDRIIFNYVS